MNEKTLYSFTLTSPSAKAKLWVMSIICVIVPVLWYVAPYYLNAATSFVITNRRVRLKKFCGQWTEIPMDNICAISRSYWFSKLVIRSAAGSIGIWGASDCDKIFETLSMNICIRQNQQAPSYELPLI